MSAHLCFPFLPLPLNHAFIQPQHRHLKYEYCQGKIRVRYVFFLFFSDRIAATNINNNETPFLLSH